MLLCCGFSHLGSLWNPVGLFYSERTEDLAENQSRSMVRLILRPFGLDYSKVHISCWEQVNWFLKYIKLVLRLMINQNGGQTFLSCFLDILN